MDSVDVELCREFLEIAKDPAASEEIKEKCLERMFALLPKPKLPNLPFSYMSAEAFRAIVTPLLTVREARTKKKCKKKKKAKKSRRRRQ
jgi:hypothetical protein